MNNLKKFLKNENGSPAVEFAILAPLLFLMLFGAFEVSRYVMANRKVESAVNDIGFILSREGTIYDIDGNGSSYGRMENSARIDSIVNSMLPILIYPFTSNSYEAEIRALARPVAATISPNSLRVMWAHKVTSVSAGSAPVSISNSDYVIDSGSASVSGSSQPTSIYRDSYGQRAELAFEGDTFILAKIAISYSDPLGFLQSTQGLNMSGGRIEKISSYAARKRWFDNGDQLIQANEVYNQMQICTDCNIFTSNSLGGGYGRDKCVDTPPADSKTGGCIFN